MFEFLLRAIVCLCFFQGGVCSACYRSVIGTRETFFVPAGSSLFLSCVVQHCGDLWKGSWTWDNRTTTTTVQESARHFITEVPLNANMTESSLKIARVLQADEGSYACYVEWSDGSKEQGHWMQVNITKGVVSERKVWHRVLVCTGAFLCFPVFLGLARCLSSGVRPQPHPRNKVLYAAVHKDRSHQPPQPLPRRPAPKKRHTPPHEASTQSQQKPELLYADISQDALRIQKAAREPVQPTIYSSVRFS